MCESTWAKCILLLLLIHIAYLWVHYNRAWHVKLGEEVCVCVCLCVRCCSIPVKSTWPTNADISVTRLTHTQRGSTTTFRPMSALHTNGVVNNNMDNLYVRDKNCKPNIIHSLESDLGTSIMNLKSVSIFDLKSLTLLWLIYLLFFILFPVNSILKVHYITNSSV